MASPINAVFILLAMLFLASLFTDLPSAVLGAVVIDAMVALIDFGEMTRYYRVNCSDWVFFMGAMVGILFARSSRRRQVRSRYLPALALGHRTPTAGREM